MIPRDVPFEVVWGLLEATTRGWFRLEFLLLERAGPGLFEQERYRSIAERFGREQAELLRRLGLVRAGGVEALREALDRYSSWRLLEGEGFEVRPLDRGRLRLRTYRCSAQAAAARRGLAYPCRGFGLAARQGFVGAICPGAVVRCRFAPPDPRPPEVPPEASCEYVVEVPGR